MPAKLPLESVDSTVPREVKAPFWKRAKVAVLLAPETPQVLDTLVVAPEFGKAVPVLNVLLRTAAFATNGRNIAARDNKRIFFIYVRFLDLRYCLVMNFLNRFESVLICSVLNLGRLCLCRLHS